MGTDETYEQKQKVPCEILGIRLMGIFGNEKLLRRPILLTFDNPKAFEPGTRLGNQLQHTLVTKYPESDIKEYLLAYRFNKEHNNLEKHYPGLQTAVREVYESISEVAKSEHVTEADACCITLATVTRFFMKMWESLASVKVLS